MFVKKSGATFALLFALFVSCTQGSLASTITVVPSEVQKQIQASINNSHSGDTILFQAGTYNLSHLALQPGRSYIGSTQGQSIIHGTGGYSVMDFSGNGLTLQHLIFDGGGVHLWGSVSGVKIEYNTFRNISYGKNGQSEWSNWSSTVGLFIDTSASNSDISYNTFENLSSQILYTSSDKNLGVSGIFAYGFSNTTINNNTFDTINEGIKIFFDHANGGNVHINSNTFTHVHRMAIEMQHWQVSSVEVAYNSLSAPLSPWKLTYGISAATGGSGLDIHNNMVDDQVESVCGPGCWVGIGIEAWGNSTKVLNNTVRGYWITGVAVGASSNLLVEGNAICGPDMANNNFYISNENGYSHSGEVFKNNTTSTATNCLE
jgi:hypothetical protein